MVRIPEPEVASPEVEARFLQLRSQAIEALQMLPQPSPQLISAVHAAESPSIFTDLVAAYLDVQSEEKQGILETIAPLERMDKVLRLLAQRIEVLRLSQEIGRQTKASLDERQRAVLLREQLATIQRQLGEDEGKAQEIAELERAIVEAHMLPEVEEHKPAKSCVVWNACRKLLPNTQSYAHTSIG